MEHKKKILVVEDEAMHAMHLKIMLKNYGYEVTETAATADHAIASVESNCPDMVLMDINLRNSIDGIEVSKILREKYSFPIVFLSGYNDDEILSRIKPIGNTWKLTKPIAENILTNLIGGIFESPIEVT